MFESSSKRPSLTYRIYEGSGKQFWPLNLPKSLTCHWYHFIRFGICTLFIHKLNTIQLLDKRHLGIRAYIISTCFTLELSLIAYYEGYSFSLQGTSKNYLPIIFRRA